MTSTPPPPASPAADPSGASWPPPPSPQQPWQPRTQLRRSRTDKVIGGVAGGLAEYTGVDALLWRIGAIALTLAGGSGVLIYLLLWVLMPAAPVGQSTVPAGAAAVAPRAPRGPRSPVPGVTLATLLIVLGSAVLLAQLTDWDLGPRGFFGTALLVVGIGLIVSAVTGAGRGAKGGLMALGVVLSLATLIASTADFHDGPRGDVGDRFYQPTTAAAVRDVYEGGVGDLEIDLSLIDPSDLPRTIETEIRHGVGDIDVIVPRNADVHVTGMGGIGEVEFEDEQISEDGAFFPGTGSGSWVGDGRAEFRIMIHNGIGDVEVSRD
ncbi:PspC domain-containing protein [Modestobacter marinus]|uniref:PspC domain-containing protein n=1 Tax=Modestobacter marinus TaxID=477641 RepID=UPI001C98A18C|nr:PspC domain-containing protein [Modestobacter marinus]